MRVFKTNELISVCFGVAGIFFFLGVQVAKLALPPKYSPQPCVLNKTE